MPKYSLMLREDKTQSRYVNVEVEAEDEESALEQLNDMHTAGQFDAALEAAEPDTTECDSVLGVERDGKGVEWIY